MATDFMEGTLTWRQRQAVWLHLAVCRGCRAFMQQMRKTVRLIASLPPTPPPRETEVRLLASLPDGSPPPP
jgi:hypothetical protein